MNIDDFWCRAFLAEWNGASSRTICKLDGLAARCVEAANVATQAANAERRLERDMLGSSRDEVQGNDAPADPPRPAPTLERVEFTAERYVGETGMWQADVHGVGVFRLWPGEERAALPDGPVIRIKWSESMPPKPIEVWLERPATSPAPPGMSDAEVAAAFYDRFRPVKVMFGSPVDGIRRAFVEDDGDVFTSGMARAPTEDHPAGEPGFVAAVLRARELVRKGGGS